MDTLDVGASVHMSSALSGNAFGTYLIAGSYKKPSIYTEKKKSHFFLEHRFFFFKTRVFGVVYAMLNISSSMR